MAVANTVTQIVLPGLDKAVVDNSISAVLTNDTVEAIRSNLAAGGSTVELNAAIATVQMKKLPNFLKTRQKNAELLSKLLLKSNLNLPQE